MNGLCTDLDDELCLHLRNITQGRMVRDLIIVLRAQSENSVFENIETLIDQEESERCSGLLF